MNDLQNGTPVDKVKLIHGRTPAQFQLRVGERWHLQGANYIEFKGPDAEAIAHIVRVALENL